MQVYENVPFRIVNLFCSIFLFFVFICFIVLFCFFASAAFESLISFDIYTGLYFVVSNVN